MTPGQVTARQSTVIGIVVWGCQESSKSWHMINAHGRKADRLLLKSISIAVAQCCFPTRDAMRDSAEAQPASNGWPGLSMSMTSGA